MDQLLINGFDTTNILLSFKISSKDVVSSKKKFIFFIIDNRMRDIASYLKSKFFKKEDIWEDIEEIFKRQYSVYEYNIFYANI